MGEPAGGGSWRRVPVLVAVGVRLQVGESDGVAEGVGLGVAARRSPRHKGAKGQAIPVACATPKEQTEEGGEQRGEGGGRAGGQGGMRRLDASEAVDGAAGHLADIVTACNQPG